MKILLIFLLFAISLERTEKKVRKTNRSNKTTENENATPCEAGVYEVKISCGSEYGTTFSATLDAKDLEVPSIGNIRGLVLSDVPTSGTCNLFTTISTTTLIEYALTTSFTGNQPFAAGLYITSTAYIANSVVPFMITFKYHEKWPIITKENFNKIVKWINRNHLNRQSNLNDYKRGAIESATIYNTYATTASNADLDSTFFSKQINDITTNISSLNAKLLELKKSYTTVDASIATAQKDYEAAALTTTSNENSSTTALSEKDSLEKTLKKLQTDFSSSSENSSIYENNYNSAYNSMESIHNTYSEEMAQLKSEWTNALTSLKSNRNKESYLTTIKNCMQIS
jgi:hypothetical protein